MTRQQLLEVTRRIFGNPPWPKPLGLIRAPYMAHWGVRNSVIARRVGSTSTRVAEVVASPDPIRAALRLPADAPTQEQLADAALMLGQLVVGRCAEMVFEEMYKRELNTPELQLVDLRESRNDTDYRVLNGQGRPIYRINIKFHGTAFRRAAEMVGLAPENCFALATYKIAAALEKQVADGLPYFFLVVSALGLNAAAVGAALPPELVFLTALLRESDATTGKRDLEDTIVEHAVQQQFPIVVETLDNIRSAEWRIVSAKRAYKLLRDHLFERVYALRVRNFTRAFSGAEVDMHFDLDADMMGLRDWLVLLRDHGHPKIAHEMAMGNI